MRKVIVSEFLTLDGVMQAPGGSDEDRRGGFEHGGWQMPYFDEVAGNAVSEGMGASGGFLLGRRTYEIFAAYWPSAPADNPFAATINSLPKFVASTTLQEPLEWNNSTLLKGDVAEEVAKLKEQPGKDLQVIGSGDLVQTLMQHNLVDEYGLMIHPVVLGTGEHLFKEGIPRTPLRLVDSKTTSTGVLILTYRPEGKEAEG
ncbi:MAG TPA: dihydrofolate reductase family protein [Actinomycetota bacterium]|jgi:dihydrofolate reductase|nr:dihydrofolate reductase family protein [Actinomycetota bacterium]